MSRLIFFLYLSLILTSFLSVNSCGNGDQQNEQLIDENGRELEFTSEVSFIRSEGDTVSTVEVAVADDNRSRSEGLMNVNELPENSGMLFIFSNDQARSFWMANTPLSLDIIFVNSNMEIVRIHRNTQPYSQESIQSEAPARFVVEVNTGYTLEHDIQEGMSIYIEGVDF